MPTTGKFTAQVDNAIAAYRNRMLAVVQSSIQDVVDDAQTPVAKGGRMRVDTGFLRASGKASLNGLPSGPTRGSDKAKPGQYTTAEGVTELTLAQLHIGQTFFWGWTASYARAREAQDAFLRMPVQRWQSIVDHNATIAKRRFK